MQETENNQIVCNSQQVLIYLSNCTQAGQNAYTEGGYAYDRYYWALFHKYGSSSTMQYPAFIDFKRSIIAELYLIRQHL